MKFNEDLVFWGLGLALAYSLINRPLSGNGGSVSAPPGTPGAPGPTVGALPYSGVTLPPPAAYNPKSHWQMEYFRNKYYPYNHTFKPGWAFRVQNPYT